MGEQWVDVLCILYWNQAAATYSSLCFFIFLSLQLSSIKILSEFSWELGWNFVQTWTVRGCIVYNEIRLLLLLIHPFSSSFFFLSNFQTLKISVTFSLCLFVFFSFFFLSNFQTFKIFVTFFSGTVRPTKLKLGKHMDNGWMYCVYQNQAAAAYLSLPFFIILSLQFSSIKSFCHTFHRNCEA